MTGLETKREIWRAFDGAWYRFAYPVVEQYLSAGLFSTPEQVYTEHGRALGHSPNPYFSEAWYLARYEPVRNAVTAGAFASGFDHFCRHGYTGHAPHWLFDSAFYSEQYKRTHGSGLDPALDGDPYDHFLRIGQHQDLSGHYLFDPAVYRVLAPDDVARRIARSGPFTTFLLHVHAGGPEPTVSNLFDPAWYLARYNHVSREIADGRWICALHHYLANPEPSRFDPSPRFSEQAYQDRYPDVAAAVAGGQFRNGFAHFLRHGRSEGRRFEPSLATNSRGTDAAHRAVVATRFPLQARLFDAVTFLPGVRDAASRTGYSFGVFDRNGQALQEFNHLWFEMRLAVAPPVQDSRRFVYGGVLMNHFGHFIRDSLAAMWFLRQHPDIPVLWHWIDLAVPHDVWPAWMEQVWRITGLDKHEHHRIVAPIAVGQVILPESGLLAPDLLYDAQAEALAVLAAGTPVPGLRVWLSRAGLPSQFGRMGGEDEVEALLAQRGWQIVRPQDQPVADQIDLFAVAEVVAGCMSSAFHAALLSKSPRARLILVVRPGIDRNFYDAAARARNLDQSYVMPDLKPFSRTDAWATYELADPSKLAGAVCALASAIA